MQYTHAGQLLLSSGILGFTNSSKFSVDGVLEPLLLELDLAADEVEFVEEELVVEHELGVGEGMDMGVLWGFRGGICEVGLWASFIAFSFLA